MGIYLIDIFEKAQKEVDIVSGELLSTHNMERSFAAMTNALDRGIEIKLVCGPWIDANSPYVDFLRKETRVELLKLPKRAREHFRLRDYNGKRPTIFDHVHRLFGKKEGYIGEALVEERHPVGGSTEIFYRIIHPRIVRDYHDEFKVLKAKSTMTTIDDFEMIPLSIVT